MKKYGRLKIFTFLCALAIISLFAGYGDAEAQNKGAAGPAPYQNKGAIDMSNSTSSFRIKGLLNQLETNDISGGTHESSIKRKTDNKILSEKISYEGTAGPSSSQTSKKYIGGVEIDSASKNTAGLASSGGAGAVVRKKGVLVDAAGGTSFFAGVRSDNVATSSNAAGITSTSFSPVLGADAGADGKLTISKKGIAVAGNASARAGAWADASINHQFKAADENLGNVNLSGGVGVGVAIGAGAGLALETDKTGLAANVAAGPIKGLLSVYLSPEGIWRAINKQFNKSENETEAPGRRIK
jgi:hypothetical protein